MATIFPFTPRFASINGQRMAYLDEGRGPVVVLVHGNPTWSFFYRHLVSLLCPNHRVIAPDHIGCGNSDKPREYSYLLEDHINNLESLLTSLGVETCSLVVHDWGGAIGFGYAVRHPERIRSLTVMNTAAFRSRRIPWRIRICRLPVLGPLLVRGFNGFARAAIFMAVRRKMAPDVAEGFLAPYDSWRNRIAIQRFVEDIPLTPSHPSYQCLAAIEGGLAGLGRIPMQIIWGGRDFCFTRHFYDEWRRRFPDAETLYLEEAGHYLLEDAFPEVGAAITAFLGRIHG